MSPTKGDDCIGFLAPFLLLSGEKKNSVSNNFFAVSIKMPKIQLLDVTKPQNKVFSVIEVPPF